MRERKSEEKRFLCEIVSTPQKGTYCFLEAEGLPFSLLGLPRNFTHPKNPAFKNLQGLRGTCQIQENPEKKGAYIAIDVKIDVPDNFISIKKEER